MKRAVHIKNGYSKKGFVFLITLTCAVIYVDLVIDIDKSHLQDIKTNEAFDPLKLETLHPDSAVNRKAYA